MNKYFKDNIYDILILILLTLIILLLFNRKYNKKENYSNDSNNSNNSNVIIDASNITKNGKELKDCMSDELSLDEQKRCFAEFDMEPLK